MDIIIPVALIIFSSAAAVLSLESKSLVYGAISLALFFLGLSLFFFYLGLAYLAIFQVAVYVGAIAVLIMFTVMVVGESEVKDRNSAFLLLGVLGAMMITGSFLFGIGYLESLSIYRLEPSFSLSDLSIWVIQNYGLIIIALALLLTSAAYGAIALARREVEETA